MSGSAAPADLCAEAQVREHSGLLAFLGHESPVAEGTGSRALGLD